MMSIQFTKGIVLTLYHNLNSLPLQETDRLDPQSIENIPQQSSYRQSLSNAQA